jgi:hypothetical protein
MEACAYTPSTQEAEAGGINYKIKTSLGYTVRLSQNPNNNNKKTDLKRG